MSSLRNAAYRRNHPERPQPISRTKFGLLEKHKDYVKRAKNRRTKENEIKKLKQKARLRNKDEFYFSMARSETSDGIHMAKRDEKLPDETVRLIKDQYLNYINLKENANRKRLEGLKDSVLITSSLRKVPFPCDLYEVEPIEELDETPKSKHHIFIDNDSDVLLDTDILESTPENKNRLDCNTEERSKKIRERELERMKDEYYKRLEVEKKLKDVQSEYQLRKNLRAKGAHIIIGKDSRGLKIYKWRQCRKR